MKETPTHTLADTTRSGHPGRSGRTPVPDYIRTQRTAPRIFSFALLLVWIVGFSAVSSELSQVKSTAGFWSEPLSLGTHQWLVVHKTSPNQCSGLFKLTLSDQQGRIKASGSGALDMSFNQPARKRGQAKDQTTPLRSEQGKVERDEAHSVRLELDAAFDETRSLEDFEALAETNLGAFTVTWSKESGQATVAFQRGEQPGERYKFAFAETAQLLVDEQLALRLHVPPELQEMLSSFPLLNGTDLRAKAAAAEELTQCAESLALRRDRVSDLRSQTTVDENTQQAPIAPSLHQPPSSPQEPAI